TATRGATTMSTSNAARLQASSPLGRAPHKPPGFTKPGRPSACAIRVPRSFASVLVCLVVVFSAAALAQPKWADPAKTIRVTFPVAETGFDPQATSDYYSSHVERAIFEPLYTFDYLARPSKVIPNIAAAMPDISADGRTWTIRIRPGVYFTDDPAFKGKK